MEMGGAMDWHDEVMARAPAGWYSEWAEDCLADPPAGLEEESLALLMTEAYKQVHKVVSR